MLLQGTNSYFILGNDQADWETRSTTRYPKGLQLHQRGGCPGVSRCIVLSGTKAFPVRPRQYPELVG